VTIQIWVVTHSILVLSLAYAVGRILWGILRMEKYFPELNKKEKEHGRRKETRETRT